MRQNYSFSKNGNALLEPCEGKLSCTVLRGESPSNGADLLDILERNVTEGYIPEVLKERVRRSHLSYYTCLDALKANDLTRVNNIVLIHISEGNGDAVAFRDGIAKATGKTVHVAKPGLRISFNKTPF